VALADAGPVPAGDFAADDALGTDPQIKPAPFAHNDDGLPVRPVPETVQHGRKVGARVPAGKREA